MLFKISFTLFSLNLKSSVRIIRGSNEIKVKEIQLSVDFKLTTVMENDEMTFDTGASLQEESETNSNPSRRASTEKETSSKVKKHLTGVRGGQVIHGRTIELASKQVLKER